MKEIKYLFLATLIAAAVVACKKDEKPAPQQVRPTHEENRMMKEIHNMMDMMDTMDMSGDPDTHFAKMMMMHHQGAINMANIVIAEGMDTTIKNMANQMKANQTMEMDSLDSFLMTHTPHAEDTVFNMKMESSMMKMHNNIDLQAVNGNLDHDFAILMIFHHQSAIEMADLVIHFGHEPMIMSMAEMMKEDQEEEIEMLQNWLLEN